MFIDVELRFYAKIWLNSEKNWPLMTHFPKVLVVGAGLIGTSIALALRQIGSEVQICDVDPKAQSLAQDLIGSGAGVLAGEYDLVIIATPVAMVFEVLLAEYKRNPHSTFIDVGGVKSELIRQVEQFPELASRFCATHPMAGREISGPSSAQSDLFEGRAWILTETEFTKPELTAAVAELVSDLGATPYRLSAQDHDHAIAGISHLPQIVSSILAQSLANLSDGSLLLAGQGLRDVSRLAASSGELWSQLLIANREQVLPGLAQISTRLKELMESISRQDNKEIKAFIDRGATERARIPGKHGAKPRKYSYLPVVIQDQPGQLAALFQECALAKVNVEDLTIEHSPGQQTGLITLALSEADALILQQHHLDNGWAAHTPRA